MSVSKLLPLPTTRTIIGAGGSSSGGNVAPDSLASNSQVRMMYAIAEGQIGGLWTGDAQSILFDTTPLQNSDGSWNYQVNNGSISGAIPWTFENGLPSQSVIPGFPAVENYTPSGIQIFHTSPATITSSTGSVDAIRVDIEIPSLYSQDNSGNVNGTEIAYHFDTKVSTSSTWTTVMSDDFTAKASSETDISYVIPNPSPGSVFNVRVVRDTLDNAGTLLQNLTYVKGYTELQYVSQTYNNTAILAISLDAKSLGTGIPTISCNVLGRYVAIPNNYNPVTRVYTGTWTGTFASTFQYTNNPAWVLWDMLTEARAGLGLSSAYIDKFSFYEAAQYCDANIVYTSGGAYVSGGVSDGAGGFEPRYTFNGVMNRQLKTWDALQQVAAVMHGRILSNGQFVKLVIDQPSTPVALITNSNTINDGQLDFDYSTASATTYYTAARVRFNDPLQNYLERDILYQATPGSTNVSPYTTFPYLLQQLNGFGITSEGQARRLAHWTIDTSLYNTWNVSFKVGPQFADLQPYDVIEVMDTNVAGQQLEARVVSTATNSVTLDRPITITTGTWTVDIQAADGVSIQNFTVTSGAGTYTTLALSGTPTGAKNSAVIFTGTIGPQFFRVTSIKENKTNEYEVTAMQYDVNKYSRIDVTPTIPTSPYFTQPTLTKVHPVTNFVFTPQSAITPDGTVLRTLQVHWSPNATDYVTGYTVSYNINNGTINTLATNSSQPEATIPLTQDGVYTVWVVAYNAVGTQSVAASSSYTATLSSPSTASPLPPVTGLQTTAGSTTVWSGPDLNVQWTAGTNTSSAVLKAYQVVLVNANTSALIKTVYVAPGTTTFSYPFAQNVTDNGTAVRNIKVQVKEQDTLNQLSTVVFITVNNAAPAVPTSITATGLQGSIAIQWAATASTNAIVGYLVWGSTTNGFTPSSANLLYQGSATGYVDTNVSISGTKYYIVAAYDVFGISLSGTGLNLSSQYSSTATSAVGITSGSSLPGSGFEGQVFFNTTDGQLYRYHSGAWTAAVPSTGITGSITDAQIAAVSASKITSQIVASQIATGAVTTGKLLVTGTGSAINNDPLFQDPTAWTVTGAYTTPCFGTTTTGQVGSNIFYASGQNNTFSTAFPLNPLKVYRVSCWARTTAGTGGLWLRCHQYNSAGSEVAYSLGFENMTVPGTWTYYSYQLTPASTSVTGRLSIDIDYPSSTGTVQLQNFQIQEGVSSDLVVNGSITGTNIAAATITGSNLVANTITAGQIASATITTSQIAANTITGSNIAATTITASNMNVTSLSAITANLGSITSGDIYGADIRGGAFTGYAWPATGAGGGFYLGPSGLLLGSYNDGKYLQVTAAGDIYAPGFSVVSGSATFSGALSAASGTFSGSLSAASGTFSGSLTTAGVVTAANLNTLSSAYSSTSTGTSASVSVTIPANAKSVVAMAEFGQGYYSSGSGKDASPFYGPVSGTLSATSSVVPTSTSYSSTASSATPPSGGGTYTFTAARTGATSYQGNVTIVVIWTQK